MTATNHALTGAVIGLVIGQPLLALPIAFLSHFVCDALPHFGSNETDNDKWVKSLSFETILIVDTSLCVILVGVLAVTHPLHWQLAAVCAFVAASPDLFSINYYLKVKMGKKWRPNLYSRFASWIQWFERPIGGFVEAAWFIAAVTIISRFV